MYPHSFSRSAFLVLHWLLTFVAATEPLFYDAWLEERAQSGENVVLPLEPRQIYDGSYPVTGVQNAGIKPRLEIRELQKNADMFNIYILGLRRFQDTPQDQRNSYYDICALHGRPYRMWDGVAPGPGLEEHGYCTHVSNLLLPWHRPFIALFEQIHFQHMVDCVNEFPPGPVRDRYARAMLDVRVPFWDWAVPPEDGACFPQVIQQPTLEVTMPNGTAIIDNPLYSYRFHPVDADDMVIDPFTSWQETLRYPEGLFDNATSQNELITPVVDNQRLSIANRLYNLLVYYDNFTQFSNEAWLEDHESADSLEALHDIIHGVTGKDGHMTYLDFSSYDGLFWLHHCMIDRIFSIYQYLHPDTYVEPMAAISPTYTIAAGSIQDADSPLEPFSRDTQGTKWTANTVKTTEQFGYDYPETLTKDPAAVRAAVNSLYGKDIASGGPPPPLPNAQKRDAKFSHQHYGHHSVHKRSPAIQGRSTADAPSVPGFYTDDGKQRHYAASVVSDKHAQNASYAVYVFIGDFDDTDPCTWANSSNLAGTHAPFTGLGQAGDAPRPTIKVSSTIPLTSLLIEKVLDGELPSMDEDDVQDFLEHNLHWRAARYDDKPIPIEELTHLSILVTMTEVQPATADDEFPTRSPSKKLTRVTYGKPGGCGEEGQLS